MGTAVRTVIGVVGVVAVWLALAATLFSGTGPAPGPQVCAAATAPPSADVRLLAPASTACTALIPGR